MEKSYEKYFVIGFNKTSTSTFCNLFNKNNLKCEHNNWNIKKYDAFCDSGNLQNYKKLDLTYKNSIFILNIRSLDEWLISRFKHGLRRRDHRRPSNLYPYTYKKCKSWMYEREKFHLNILNYFSNKPHKLIIVNIDKPGWMEYICTQLKFKNKVDAMNIHKTDEHNLEHIKIINLVNETLDKHKYKKKTILFQDNKLVNKYINIYKNFI